ncbi:retinaldehyde-binding protein 1-like [Haliotis rufescens]|uniref:retinaldehyde-binding protein 1-like n=1 Tax=Haliotis rufescens TaxID=6454 RepID=UPI00201EBE2A|nr:retinaldehyde-binding protein 1-like [Haliotis rufescens]XP_046332383.2 retinaldehyde-binding protein 1-like [Haliotis rufescens]XP_046332384.2 retinaldehyde-binding protein 1-like [Haliotis rufescens]
MKMSEPDTRTNTTGPNPKENSIPVPEDTPNPAKQEDNTIPTEETSNPKPEVTSNPTPEVTSNPTPEVTSNPTPEVTTHPSPEVTSNPPPDEQQTEDSNNQPATETTVTETTDPRPTDSSNSVPNGEECNPIEKGQPLPVENEPSPTALQRHISVPTKSSEEKREFYREILSPCGELSQALKEKAESELNETDAVRSEKMLELRKMLMDEDDTEKGDAVSEYFGGKEDKYLMRFLRTKKFDVKKTYDMMEAYVKFRSKYQSITDQLTFNGVRHALEESFPGVLPVKDKQGHVVIIYDTGSWDHDKLSFDEMLASFLFLLENLVENEENQIRGFVVLETYEDYHITQAMRMKASDIKKLVDMLQGAFPGRFKGFHVIRQPWYFSMVMALARPFMRNKLASRIFVHGNNLKKLYEWISPEHLPERYGGIGEDYDPQPLIDELRDSLLQRGAQTL